VSTKALRFNLDAFVIFYVNVHKVEFLYQRLVDWSEGGDSCGKAQNVRCYRPRVSEGCGLRMCPRKAPPATEINVVITLYVIVFSDFFN